MKGLVFQKCISRVAFAIIISFLWDRYIRFSDLMTIANYPLLFFAALYLMFAWFNYLKLDGLHVLPTNPNKDKQPIKKRKPKMKQMIDYVDTELQPDIEFSTKQLLQAKLYSNVICGVLLAIPSIIGIAI